MKRRISKTGQKQTAPALKHKRLQSILNCFLIGSQFSHLPPGRKQSNDDMLRIYIDPEKPVDVSAQYSYQDDTIYDPMTNTVVGVVLEKGLVHDLSGEHIGYIIPSLEEGKSGKQG